jgi:hypothetical protein
VRRKKRERETVLLMHRALLIEVCRSAQKNKNKKEKEKKKKKPKKSKKSKDSASFA